MFLRPVAIATGLCALLAGCTPEPPGQMPAEDAPLSVKEDAITLDQARERRLVRVTPVSASSTAQEMTLALEPLTTQQPWILIGPGWQVRSRSEPENAFATLRSVYVRLDRERELRVRIPHVQLRPVPPWHLPADGDVLPVDDEAMLALLREVDRQNPPWRVAQLAAWVLGGNPSYDRLRGNKGEKPPLTLDNAEIEPVLDLLTAGGSLRSEFRIYTEPAARLDQLSELYQTLLIDEETSPLAAFTEIASFYPFEASRQIVAGAFDQHPGPKGNPFRRVAIETLGRQRGAQELRVLRERIGDEQDESLSKEMRSILDGKAGEPAKPD